MSVGLICLLGAFVTVFAADSGPTIRQVVVAEPITPVTARFVEEQLRLANAQNEEAFLLLLDTPGGLVSAMRTIVQAQLRSDVPTIVYVTPPGARAASAGALITLAADFAVMAPGTNIGAASPVSIGIGGQQAKDETMKSKVMNDAIAYSRSIAEQRGRNVTWAEEIVRDARSSSAQEARDLKVVDLVARSVDRLLEQLDARTYLRDGRAYTLRTQGAQVIAADMDWRLSLLSALSNPTVAYLLLMLGILGIFFEVSQPGTIFPGSIGALALLLAFFGFATLPINVVGALLLLLALILFVLEVAVVSYGMLTVGGLVSLVFGSLILIDSNVPWLQISGAAIGATVLVFAAFIAFVLYFVVRTHKKKAVSGHEGMLGAEGVAVVPLAPKGRVFIHGEYWTAISSERVDAGSPIHVVALEGLTLKVRPSQQDGAFDLAKGEKL